MEKTIVAAMPGTVPTPKKNTAGMRYTKTGMACMRSRTGRMTALTEELKAAQIPKGMPINRAAATDTSTIARLAIVSSHSPMESMSRKATAEKMVIPRLRVMNAAMAVRRAMITSGCRTIEPKLDAADDLAGQPGNTVEEPAKVREKPINEGLEPPSNIKIHGQTPSERVRRRLFSP